MDRKSIIILIVCFILLMLWVPLVNRLFPPVHVAASTNVSARTQTNLSAEGTGTNGFTTPVISEPTLPAPSWIRPTAPEEFKTLENDVVRCVFTSHGGGLKRVELLRYHDTVGRGKRTPAATNRFATLNRWAPVPALTLFGGSTLEDSTPFQLTKTEAGLRAEKDLTNGLRLVKVFRLGTNYSLTATIRIENRSRQAVNLPLRELVVGTATPINRDEISRFLGVQWYDGESPQFVDSSWFDNRSFAGCLGCVPAAPRTQYDSPGLSNVVWVATHSQFFTMIAAPETNALRLVARRVDLPPPTAEERAEDPRAAARPVGIEAAIVYAPVTLPPGQAIESHLDLFAGPKEYNTLAKLPKNQDLAMNFSKFFGWFAKALLLSMNGLHHALHLSYGLCIITITVIIKLLFWPLTQASTRSMRRMQALQPQMKEIQQKYKDDPRKMNQKVMEFYKENKVNPLGGCLPMLFQIPVFIGFYQMLQSAIELRGESFLWAYDLSQPDTVAMIYGFPINPLPLLMGASQFWQARMTPASPSADPMQQKMLQYMPLIFVFMLYNFASGLALYWMVQNLLSILQMKLTKVNLVPHGTPAAAAAARPTPAKRKR
jgi:YidC/Oxa1 family membrane protein insertase